MKNYSPNRITPSKSFYVNELKKSNKNLINKSNQLDFLEKKFQKLLDMNYNFLRPFFENDDDLIAENYKSNSFKKDVDADFDEKIEAILPTWINRLIALFISIYHRLIRTKVVQSLVKLTKKAVYYFIKLLSTTKHLKTIKFFTLKSSP
jgi:hypothetical protein